VGGGLVPALSYSVRELHYGKLMPYSKGVEKLRVAHLVSIFRAVFGTRRLFTVLIHVICGYL